MILNLTLDNTGDHAYIHLTSENDQEKKLLEKGENKEVIDLYYHKAVDEKLGSNFSLGDSVDETKYPWALTVKIIKNGELGR